MTGSDVRGPAITLSIIIIPSCLYYTLVVVDLEGQQSLSLIIINVSFLLFTLFFMLRTVMMDPGIIPRRKLPSDMTKSMFFNVQRYIRDKVIIRQLLLSNFSFT